MFSILLSGDKRIFNKMGYFSDQDGIMRRYIREADHWKAHIENTKAAIINSTLGKGKRKVAILGSGWLLDVPVQELSSIFGQVWLFDIQHPPQIKRKAGKLPNIQFVETDISGFAIAIYNMVRQKSKLPFSIDAIKPMFNFDLNGFDLVVSCNVLNQLDILLLDYLKSSVKISSGMELQLRKLIQETHINLLPKSRSCLISDVEELTTDKEDNIIYRKKLVYSDLLNTNAEREWIWHFDNHYTYNTKANTWFRVIAQNF
jgi:hypothetical protein